MPAKHEQDRHGQQSARRTGEWSRRLRVMQPENARRIAADTYRAAIARVGAGHEQLAAILGEIANRLVTS